MSGQSTESVILIRRYGTMDYFAKFSKNAISYEKAPRSARCGNKSRIVKYAFLFYFLMSFYPICFAQNDHLSRSSHFVVDQARKRLFALRSLKANIRMNVYIDKNEFSAQGKYVEESLAAAPGEIKRSRFRVDLDFPLSTTDSQAEILNEIRIVCDANRINRFQSIEGIRTLAYINVDAVLDAVKRSPRKAEYASLGEMGGIGGISGVIDYLKNVYEFEESAQESFLKSKPPLPVWKLAGKLRRAQLDMHLTRLGWSENSKEPFPSHLPTEIEIFLGKDDYFPYRIHYYNTSPRNGKKNLITQLVFCDVITNEGDIPDYQFTINNLPKGIGVPVDMTAEYINSLGLSP